jgi:beta-N-acetylhexosaminidase
VLRNQYGFSGVTITDAMEAGAVTLFGTAAENTVRAAKVGMDLLLFSAKNVDQGVEGLDALGAAIKNGSLDQGRFNASVLRVLALRLSVGAAT